MNKKSMKTVLGVAALSLLASCNSTYAPNVDSTVSLKGTDVFKADSHRLLKITLFLNGLRMPSSVSLSTGEFIPFLHTAVNGIPAGCTRKVILLISITYRLTVL